MKKSLVFALLLFLPSLVSGQQDPEVESPSPVLEQVDFGALEPERASLSQEEFQAQVSGWQSLAEADLPGYLERFRQFLELSLPRYEMQPYVLAECLWFRIALLPRFQQAQDDGGRMEGLDLLPGLEATVAAFLAELGDGSLPIHPQSDAVLSLFQYLGQNPVAGSHGPALQPSNLPELPVLAADHPFIPIEESYRNARLYRGIMAFSPLMEDFAAARGGRQDSPPENQPAGETPQASGEGGDSLLPPPLGNISWKDVVENQPLMYLLRHVPAGGEVYSHLQGYHSGKTLPSRCEDVYLEGQALGRAWGYRLEQVLPSFSASGVEAVGQDPFVLYCLSEGDLERLLSDLSCVNELAPAYLGRSIALLRRGAGLEAGGSL